MRSAHTVPKPVAVLGLVVSQPSSSDNTGTWAGLFSGVSVNRSKGMSRDYRVTLTAPEQA